MGTSLAEQLKKLALPQTSLLVQGRIRLSLLFNPREAARFDRDTFYEIGINGLDELVKLNPEFLEFRRNLFDLSSQYLERSVEDKKTNKILNKLIRKMLLLLSPYFLLKATHRALEWLVYRFHIQLYNVEDIMCLILPYHDTRIFVRVLQMIDVSNASNKWHWLHPLQGPGIPLSKTTLINRCASDTSFLNFVCEMTSDIMKANKNQDALSTLLAFYCTTILGGLEYLRKVNELQMTFLLKSLLEGLTSPVLDYVSCSYMIIVQLARNTQLSPKVFSCITQKIAECTHKELYSDCVVVLTLMYQMQRSEELKCVQVETVKQLMHGTWFSIVLGKLFESDVLVTPFFAPLLRGTLSALQAHKEFRMDLCKFAKQITGIIKKDNEAELIIQTVIESLDVDAITAQSVDEDERQELLSWFTGLLKTLECQYAKSFDKVILNIFEKSDALSKDAKALRILLDIRKYGNTSINYSSLFERIHHSNFGIRIEAVKYLVDNFASIQIADKDLLHSAVIARLRDDNVKVVKLMLEIPTEKLIEILGKVKLVDELTWLCVQYLNKTGNDYSDVAGSLVKHLCSDKLISNSAVAKTHIMLVLLPFLFPVKEKEFYILSVFLQQHSFIEKCKLLSSFVEELRATNRVGTLTDVCSAFVNCLTGTDSFLPDVELLLAATEKFSSEKNEPVYILLLLLLLNFSISKNQKPAFSHMILDIAISYVQKFKMSTVKLNADTIDGRTLADCVRSARAGYFPLSVFLQFVSLVTQHTLVSEEPLPVTEMWWTILYQNNIRKFKDSRPDFVIKVLELLIRGCALCDTTVSMQYATCLQKFFKSYFPTSTRQMTLLCNIIACPSAEHLTLEWSELRLYCLHLMGSLLKSSFSRTWTLQFDSPVVPSLLIAANSPISPIRHAALKCMFSLPSLTDVGLDSYILVIEALKERYEEIILDTNELLLVIYTSLSPEETVWNLSKSRPQSFLPRALNALLDIIISTKTPPYISSGLLEILSSVNSQEVLAKLLPFGQHILSSAQNSDTLLDCYSSAILHNIFQRFTRETAPCLKQSHCWKFVHSSIMNWKTVLQGTAGRSHPSILMMHQISSNVFEELDQTLQLQLLMLFVVAASDSEMPEVASAAEHVIKKITLNSKLVAVLLEKMKNVQLQEELSNTAQRKRFRTGRNQKELPSPELLKTEEWRHGITVLQWVQCKKKLLFPHLLLPSLFSLLDKCLEFEEQAPVEYSKQLLLSCLLHCCQKVSSEDNAKRVMQEVLNVEGVMQCIRASQNPQTHHHALLLLTHIAGIIPEQVSHNIMAIFTFMGSSILRQDDAYSFQVISKIVDTIIPTLIKGSEVMAENNVEFHVSTCSVLRVLADTALHIPEHRRLILFKKIFNTLGPEHSLWMFLCLVLEGLVTLNHEEQTGDHWVRELPPRQEFALTVIRSFPPHIAIATCIKMLTYVQNLPFEKDETVKQNIKQRTMSSDLQPYIFSVEHHTAKQLRHFRYTVYTFVKYLLSSPVFINQVASLSDDAYDMKSLYELIIQNIVINIQDISQKCKHPEQLQATRYWNAILGLAHDILDKVNALLPNSMFLVVINILLRHKLSTVCHKAIELLNARLHQISFIKSCDKESLGSLLEPLLVIVGNIGDTTVESIPETTQQVALLSLKLLARHVAPENPLQYKQILEQVAKLVQLKTVQKNLLATALVCLAELISSLQVHSISYLSHFMPAVIEILYVQREVESPNLVLLSSFTAIQKIVESLSQFLNPYLETLLLEVSIQTSKWCSHSADSKVTPLLSKLKVIGQKISDTIPVRILTPVISQCYYSLIKQRHYAAIGPLLNVLGNSFSTPSTSDFTHLMPELTTFFLSALQCRTDYTSGKSNFTMSEHDIAEIEGHAINALIALMLKLSESTFRPMYYSLFHWATSSDAHKNYIITFYRLSYSIADCLKGLFVLFAGILVQNAAELLVCLNTCHTNRVDSIWYMEDDTTDQLLLQYLLQTLQRIFQCDSGQVFINKERFDAIMLPLVDQLENTLGGVDALQSRVSSLLIPCIAEFAVAVADDAFWKQLNYQILLKTRHSLPEVRKAALEVLCEIAHKLGEDFLPLLPETVPFLAELLEDEEEIVELTCKRTVQLLEEVLGEPIKKYF